MDKSFFVLIVVGDGVLDDVVIVGSVVFVQFMFSAKKNFMLMYSILVINELFHNGNVEVWKWII